MINLEVYLIERVTKKRNYSAYHSKSDYQFFLTRRILTRHGEFLFWRYIRDICSGETYSEVFKERLKPFVQQTFLSNDTSSDEDIRNIFAFHVDHLKNLEL